MCTFLCDFAFFQNYDLVGIPYRAQPMGDNDYGLVFEEAVQIVLYRLFIVCIERIGGFVENR